VPVPSAFDVEMVIEKIKRHKSPGTDQISVELIKGGDRTISFETYERINSIWNREILPEDWKESIVVPIYMKDVPTGCSYYTGISIFSTT